MNIFMVDEDPAIAAKCLGDKHVVKMILESAQLLSTAHRVLDGDNTGHLSDLREGFMYKKTHENHPCAKWVRESISNYLWLVDHLHALLMEYEHRYNKKHKVLELFYYLQSPPQNLEKWEFTPAPSCMPEAVKISKKTVDNYRNYYIISKSHLHKWTNREKPEWID